MKAQTVIGVVLITVSNHRTDGFSFVGGRRFVNHHKQHQRVVLAPTPLLPTLTRRQRKIDVVVLKSDSSSSNYYDDDQYYWDDVDDNSENFIRNDGDEFNEEYNVMSPRERRRRRRRQRYQDPTSAASSFLSSSNIPQRVVSVGNKATKIAKSKTKQAWKNLMEFTYDERFEDYDEEYSNNNYNYDGEDTTTGSQPPSQRRPTPKVSRSNRETSSSSSSSSSRRSGRPQSNYQMKSQQRRHRQQQRRGDYNGTEFKPSSRNDKRRNDFQRRGDVSEQDEQKSMTSKETTKQSQEDDQQKNNGASEDRPPKRQSIQEILTELDKMGISYSPTSSRKELEELLLSSATSTNGGDADDDEKASWRGLWQKTSKVASKKSKSIPRKIVDKAERTAQKAQTISQQAISNLLDDDDNGKEEENEKGEEDIILDAIIEDFSQDSSMTQEERFVDAEPLSPEEWYVRSRNSRPRTAMTPPTRSQPRSRASQERRPRTSRRRRPQPRRPRYVQVQYDNDPDVDERDAIYRYSDMEDDDGVLKLPPSDYPNTQRRSRRVRRPRRPRPNSSYESSSRRVYSPYKQKQEQNMTGEGRGGGNYDDFDDNDDLEDFYRDGVDNVGHFVANAVDSFLWGRDEGYYQQVSTESRQRRQHKRSGHWKDRMEEQFDQILGIHEGGKYYDRWAYKQDLYNANATGTDALSYARGRGRRKNSRRSRPLWEEDGSILSVLFGTGEDAFRRNSHLYRSSSSLRAAGGGSVLRMSRSLIQSFTIVAGSLGRWASVRGSLPQPVIMVSIISAALSSRPGRRLQTVVFAVLALRMLGELLHGYVWDDLDFEDDMYDDYEDDNDDYNDNENL